MAWRQQVQLLQRLSTTSRMSDFRKCYDSVRQLCLKMQDWSEGSKGRDSPDSNFVRGAFTACRSGMKALCEALKAKQRVDRETKCCISMLIGLTDNLLRTYVGGGLDRDLTAEAAAGARKDSSGAAQLASFGEIQTLMTKIGFHESLADIFSAIAATFSQFLCSQTDSPSSVNAAAQQNSRDSKGKLKHQDPTTLSATAPFPLAFIKRLLCLWMRFHRLSTAHGVCAALAGFGQTPSHGFSLGPQLQATLQPVCSLLLVLLRYEHCMGIDMSSCMITDDGKDPVYAALCIVMLTVACMPKLSYINWFRSDDTFQRPAPAFNDSNRLQSPDIHALLLFKLAAVAHALHREQKGKSPAVLLEARPTSSHSSNKARKKQQLKVVDFSISILQDLGVSKAQAQRLWRNFIDIIGHSPRPAELQDTINVVLEHVNSGFGQHSKQSSSGSSSTRKLLPDMLHNAIMLLKLLVQLTALQPSPSEVNDNLGNMRKTSYSMIKLHEVHGSDRKTSAITKAALAEITDSILAPFVLQVGPAVLHALQQPDCNQELQNDIRKKWFYVLGVFQAAKMQYTGAVNPCYCQAINAWSVILQEQPATAVTAVEIVLRTMAEEADQNTAVFAMLLTNSLSENVFRHHEPYVTAATSDVHSSQQWHKDLAGKPITLLISCLKLYNVLSMNKENAAQLFQCIIIAMKAASKMDLAISTEGGHTPHQPKHSTTVPPASWVHVIARLLHCSSHAMLQIQTGTSGVVDISKLTREPAVLPAAAAWCNEQAKLLYCSRNISGSTSAAAANDSGKGPYSEILKQLRLLYDQLQQADCWKTGFISAESSYDRPLALQLQQYAEAMCAVFPTTLCCNNPNCSNVSGLSELACVGRRKCSKCQGAGYCSRECQVQHWSQHKKICSLLC